MSSSAKLSFDSIVRYLPHLPSPKQRKFLNYSCVEALFGGAAGGGKSDALLMAALQGVIEPSYSAILFRRTYQDLSLPGALLDRSHQWWGSTDAHWDSDTKMWRFPCGSRIGFGYLDSPRDHLRYQSAEFQFVAFDEASQFAEQQSLYLLSRLRAPNDFPSWLGCRWRGGTNPGGIGHEWLQKRYQIPTDGSKESIEQRIGDRLVRAFVPSLARDNPGLNVVDYLSKLALLDPITRAQLEEGKWIIDASGLVYSCYASHCNVTCLPQHIAGKEWHYVLGMDYASTHDRTTFAVCAYTDYEPEVYLCWTEAHSSMSPSDCAKRCEELGEQFGSFVQMVGDSGGLGAAYVLEMQKHWAIPVIAAEKTNKLGYIKLFNGELANHRLKIVAPYCETWIQEACVLLWKDPTRQAENPSQHNDSTDAALYSWRACRHYAIAEREQPKSIEDEYEEQLIARAQGQDWQEDQQRQWS